MNLQGIDISWLQCVGLFVVATTWLWTHLLVIQEKPNKEFLLQSIIPHIL